MRGFLPMFTIPCTRLSFLKNRNTHLFLLLSFFFFFRFPLLSSCPLLSSRLVLFSPTNKHHRPRFNLHLQSDGQASNAVNFSYSPPVITGVACPACTTAGGMLTLTGTSFGSSTVAGTTASVTVAGNACTVSTNYPFNHTKLVCALPAGQGAMMQPVYITISGQVRTYICRGGRRIK